MKPTVHLTKRAEAQLRAACAWYEEQRIGLGDELVEDVDEKLDEIRGWPRAFATIDGTVRAARLGRFPYKIMFLAHEMRVEVLVLHHERRDPIAWNDHESP